MSVETAAALTLESLVSVDTDLEPYVLTWPTHGEEGEDGALEVFGLVVLKRREGLLLATPVGVLPDGDLELGKEGNGILGPSTEVEVPAVIMDGGKVHSTGGVVKALLVDCTVEVLPLLRLPLAFEEIAYGFDMDSPYSLPDPGVLLQVASEWIEDFGPQGVLGFYTAEEPLGRETDADVFSRQEDQSPVENGPVPPGERTPVTPLAKRASRPRQPTGKATQRGPGNGDMRGEKPEKAKRITNASLAASLEQLLGLVPSLSSQVQDLALKTKNLENQILAPVSAACPALRRPLSQSVAAAPSAHLGLMSNLPSPPKTSAVPNPGLLRSPVLSQPPDLKALELEKPGSSDLLGDSHLVRAVYAQSQALNSLVSQIASSSSDPLVDLSGASSSGTRGSLGRAKLQMELASQKGVFFASVLSAMARRMNPTAIPDASPQRLMDLGVCGTKYIERFGGYSRHRELGQLQYQVMQILDFLQTENWTAARDHAALLAVTIEQTVMDNGKMDLASVLCLQDDLPAGIFQNRNAGVLARNKSFSPLADQRWITVAIAYLKEMDTIAAKRSEISGVTPPKASPATGPPGPKAKPGAKKKGKGKGTTATPAEEPEDA
eukprot:s550_g11.t1